MLKVILTKGLPASGKTSWVEEQMKLKPNSFKNINKDDLRAMLDMGHFSPDAEKFILKTRDHLIKEALRFGKHVIISDTNLHHKHQQQVESILRELKKEGIEAQVEIREFDTSLAECIERDKNREASVGEDVIRKMHQQFVVPAIDYNRQDPSLPFAIISDLDGTLAEFNTRDKKAPNFRNPYNASTCENDFVNSGVEKILRWAHTEGTKIFLFSGRESKYMPQTQKWLKHHDIPHQQLVMRQSGDKRPDHEVKKEMYYQFISGRYNVLFVLDDRDQVVDLWRSLGIRCFQVNYGNF